MQEEKTLSSIYVYMSDLLCDIGLLVAIYLFFTGQ